MRSKEDIYYDKARHIGRLIVDGELDTALAELQSFADAERTEQKVEEPPATETPPEAAPSPLSRIPSRWAWGAGAIGLVAMAAWLGFTSLSEPPPEPIMERPPEPIVAKLPMGQVRMDAFPWGQVTSIESSEGEAQDVPAHLFTPTVLSLPTGSYVVVIENPGAEEPWSCQVEVRSEAAVDCLAPFETIDALDYFAETDWWQ